MASANSSKLFGIVAVLYLFPPAPQFVQGQHPSCTLQSGMSVACYAGGYILPTNFDSNSIPSQENIQMIAIGGTGNLGHDSREVALPHLPKLTYVYLDNFNENAHWPFPLNTFLTNNKAQLTSLLAIRVKLLKLTSASFSGFNNLKTLVLFKNDLTSVAMDAFSNVAALAPISVVMVSNYKLQIANLEISNNPQLSGLDWALLAPIAGNLKELKMHANALETEKLVNSLEFKLTAVDKIDFSGNRLTNLLPEVLDTLTHVAGSKLSMAIGENRFCGKRPAGDCSCCELAAFADWMRRYGMGKADLTFTCGAGYSPNAQALFTDANLHQHCARPPTGCNME